MSIIAPTTMPSSWKLHRFGHAAPRVQLVDQPGLEPLSVFLDEGVVPRASREDNHNQLGEDLGKYLVVRPGDIVFNKLRTWQGGLGVSRYEGIVSPAYFVCRPTPAYDPRYLHYLLRSQPYLQELTRISKWMPPSQFDIGWEQLRLLPVMTPPRATQRAIANYLDAETARIDALIASKKQMTHLADERRAWMLDDWVQAHGLRYGVIPLRRLTTLVEQGWSPECDGVEAEPEEWGVLKTSAVTSGEFRPWENKRLPVGIVPDLRWMVTDGDLLVIRGSGSMRLVGQAAVARTEGRRLMISDLIYRLHVPGSHTGFIAAVLGSRRVRGILESSIRTDAGQTLKVRVDDLKDLPIPATPLHEQVRSWEVLNGRLATLDSLKDSIDHQIKLLREHCQALITAAVTGELEIAAPEAAA